MPHRDTADVIIVRKRPEGVAVSPVGSITRILDTVVTLVRTARLRSRMTEHDGGGSGFHPTPAPPTKRISPA
jgi:hypothetical protein